VDKKGVPAFDMGLGVNTATTVVGDMGSVQSFDYTCFSGRINLISSLERQSKSYGVHIVLGVRTTCTLENKLYNRDKIFHHYLI